MLVGNILAEATVLVDPALEEWRNPIECVAAAVGAVATVAAAVAIVVAAVAEVAVAVVVATGVVAIVTEETDSEGKVGKGGTEVVLLSWDRFRVVERQVVHQSRLDQYDCMAGVAGCILTQAVGRT